MDTIFTTENSQPTKTLADYINEGKSFLEACQALNHQKDLPEAKHTNR